MLRISTILFVILSWTSIHAQDENALKFAFRATAYCKDTQAPIPGLVIQLSDGEQYRDSLLTDSMGVARTHSGDDELLLPSSKGIWININYRDLLSIRDRVVTDTLQESTTFVKEYFVLDCHGPIIAVL